MWTRKDIEGGSEMASKSVTEQMDERPPRLDKAWWFARKETLKSTRSIQMRNWTTFEAVILHFCKESAILMKYYTSCLSPRRKSPDTLTSKMDINSPKLTSFEIRRVYEHQSLAMLQHIRNILSLILPNTFTRVSKAQNKLSATESKQWFPNPSQIKPFVTHKYKLW